MSKSGRIFVFWSLFLIYGVPTLFIAMLHVTGLVPPVPWWFYVWGGSATAFAYWIRSTPPDAKEPR